jgi:GNAT superfamily N-acetyltransferase
MLMISFLLTHAGQNHLEQLMPLVCAYHEFEQIEMSDAERLAALTPLLDDSALGKIWLLRQESDEPIGYVAVCFGYSIEFKGRDAFVDEFYLVESARGQGIGRHALGQVIAEVAGMGIVALHLEVARSNSRACRFYEDLGFMARDRYHLMSCPVHRADRVTVS